MIAGPESRRRPWASARLGYGRLTPRPTVAPVVSSFSVPPGSPSGPSWAGRLAYSPYCAPVFPRYLRRIAYATLQP